MSVNINRLLILTFIVFFLVEYAHSQSQVWSLQQCIDSAKVYNKSLKISENTIELSEQKRQESIAGLIPKISAVADYKYYIDQPYNLIPMTMFGGPEGQFKETQFGVPHNISATLQMQIPLFNAQIYGGIKATAIGLEMSELQYRKTEEQLLFDISNLYYTAQILSSQIIFIEKNIENTEILLKNTELLHNQLLAKQTDVTKVSLLYEQLQTQKLLVQNRLDLALANMNFMLGQNSSELIVTELFNVTEFRTELATGTSLDVELVNMQNKLIESELDALKLSRLPSLSAYGAWGKTGFGYDEEPNNFLNFYDVSYVGVQFSYPIFNGTVTQRKINQKKIELRNSNLRVELLTEQSDIQTKNAYNQLLTAQKTILNTQKQINLAQNIYDNTLLQQKEGTASLTDVLLADNALREAQQLNINALADYLKAELELRKLTNQIINE